jgi:broad specificity phosphatase PhoE
MSGVPTIWFVRHGQTDWNAEGRLQGHRDTDLNANGLAHAAEAAARLRRIAGAELPTADYVASPLTRTRRTMEILRTGIGLPAGGYRADMRLREIGFGAWEGRTWAEIPQAPPRATATAGATSRAGRGRRATRWSRRGWRKWWRSYAARP